MADAGSNPAAISQAMAPTSATPAPPGVTGTIVPRRSIDAAATSAGSGATSPTEYNENANSTIDDLAQAAVDLAAFVKALRRVDTADADPRPRGARGGPLADLDRVVRRSIAELGDRIDGRAALRAWEESLNASKWDGEDVWVHGDLLPGNLLVVDGHLSGVIDFGCLNVGDPACDLQPAWNVFADDNRARYRAELQADDASWLRGRGWALFQAVVALPYYWDTNPGMVRQASNALAQVLADG